MSNKTTTRSMKKKIASTAALFICFSALALCLQLAWTAHSARACLASVRQLVPGTSTMAEVQAIQQRFPTAASNSNHCSTEKCSVKFVFQSWASRLYIIGPAGMEANIVVKNGTVASVDLLYSQEKSVLLALAEAGDQLQK